MEQNGERNLARKERAHLCLSWHHFQVFTSSRTRIELIPSPLRLRMPENHRRAKHLTAMDSQVLTFGTRAAKQRAGFSQAAGEFNTPPTQRIVSSAGSFAKVQTNPRIEDLSSMAGLWCYQNTPGKTRPATAPHVK